MVICQNVFVNTDAVCKDDSNLSIIVKRFRHKITSCRSSMNGQNNHTKQTGSEPFLIHTTKQTGSEPSLFRLTNSSFSLLHPGNRIILFSLLQTLYIFCGLQSTFAVVMNIPIYE
jgi:hypothetical protein